MRERHASNGRSNRFLRLTGKLSRLSETCARGQEAVNLLQNTPRAHFTGSGKLRYSNLAKEGEP
jgi:hypothetical protein